MWPDASPKHAGGMNMCMPGYSPLYRMEPYEGPLPEEERLICEVRDWLRGDAEKGRRLSEALMCEMSSDEIREFMAGRSLGMERVSDYEQSHPSDSDANS